MARIRREAAAVDIVWRVAVYIRLSREDGGEESSSVTNQKSILNEYLATQFTGQFAVADCYVDDGLTGTDDTREGFARMIQDIEQGKVNCVLVKTLSRAFRNYADQGYYLEYYFPQQNVRFISTGDPVIDTYRNPEAVTGLEVPITGLMNDRYAAKISSDVRRTFDHKRRNGEFIGAFAPYGYLKDPENRNRLVLDEAIVPIKKAMLHWIINEGMSLAGAAKRLNEQGISNPSAYKRSRGMPYNNPRAADNDGLWTGQTVRRILTDKVNLGHMVQGKQRVVSYKVHDIVRVPEKEWFVKEHVHAPTFTQEEYDKLMCLLQRDTRTANGSRTVHLFSGYLRCADCNKALQRTSAKGHTYYCCRTYREKSKTKCTKHTIRLDRLEAAVLAAVQTQIALSGSLDRVIREVKGMPPAQDYTARLDQALYDKQCERTRLEHRSDGLYEDWKTGEIDRDEYQRLKSKYRQQISVVDEIIVRLEDEIKCLNEDRQQKPDALEDLLRDGNIRTLDRALLAELIDTIFVHENQEITIVFRFADGLAEAAQAAPYA